MAKRDYYETLGVSKDADEKDIKKAYRRVAMKFHPDRNPDDPDADNKFKEATEAYDILMDREKRQAYDQFGHAGVDPSMGGGAGGFGGGNFSDIFGDVFGDIFGGGRGGRAGPQRGSDLRYTLDISLEDAVRGTTVEIRVPTLATCDTCDGSGAKKGSSPVPCGTCRGQGRIEKSKTLSVKVPPGVDTGDRIRLSGEGEAGPEGGPPGDLYVQMSVKQHAIFERDGKNLYCEVPITFVDAALGGELEVPTLDGRVKLKIPPETQTGKLFRLRGKGVQPVRGGAVGDLLCRAVVETPVHLSKKQKEMLREFQESLGEGGHAQSPRQNSWFEGVKSFFDELKP